MCINCYIEKGKPRIINKYVLSTAAAVQNVYSHPDCTVGGYGHIVFDDWNLDTESIKFCIQSATNGKQDIDKFGTMLCLDALHQFRGLSVEERATALAIAHGYITLNTKLT